MQIMVSFISATTINSWAEANPRRAQEILPELVIRLILVSSNLILINAIISHLEKI